jgi:hypothetical protein
MVRLVFIALLKVMINAADTGTPLALLAGTLDTMAGWARELRDRTTKARTAILAAALRVTNVANTFISFALPRTVGQKPREDKEPSSESALTFDTPSTNS